MKKGRFRVGRRFGKVILGPDLQETGRLPPDLHAYRPEKGAFWCFGEILNVKSPGGTGGSDGLVVRGHRLFGMCLDGVYGEVAVFGSDQSVQPRKTEGLRRTDIRKTGRTKSGQTPD